MEVDQRVKKIWKHPDGRSRITIGIVTGVRDSGRLYVDHKAYEADGRVLLKPLAIGYTPSLHNGAGEWQRWHIDHIEPIE
jgi:hypothetical protein